MIWKINKPHNLIGVVFTDEKILLAEIYHNKELIPEIKHFAQLDLCNFELINLSIFNQIKISSFINNFIVTNKLQNLPVVFCLDGSKLTEFYNEKPSCENKITNKNICDCQICQTYNTTKTDFDGIAYYCQISYSVLFQYKLLAINIGLNLISIITDIVAINELLQNSIEKEKNLIEFSDKRDPEILRNHLNKVVKNLNLENKIKGNFLNHENQYAIKQLLGLSYIF